MTADEYKEHLKHFGVSQHAAAEYFKVSIRTGASYASGEAKIPHAVAMVLRTARRLNLSLEDYEKLAQVNQTT